MEYQTLNFDVDSGVATITLNLIEALNAMSLAMAKELHEVALQIDANNSVRVVILTGTGKAFCAGGDLGAFVAAGEQARTLILQMTEDLLSAVETQSQSGAGDCYCGKWHRGGCTFPWPWQRIWPLPKSRPYSPWLIPMLGLSPDGSSTYFMPRKIGDRRTRELMLTNRLLTAPEALDWGVVNQVVEGGKP